MESSSSSATFVQREVRRIESALVAQQGSQTKKPASGTLGLREVKAGPQRPTPGPIDSTQALGPGDDETPLAQRKASLGHADLSPTDFTPGSTHLRALAARRQATPITASQTPWSLYSDFTPEQVANSARNYFELLDLHNHDTAYKDSILEATIRQWAARCSLTQMSGLLAGLARTQGTWLSRKQSLCERLFEELCGLQRCDSVSDEQVVAMACGLAVGSQHAQGGAAGKTLAMIRGAQHRVVDAKHLPPGGAPLFRGPLRQVNLVALGVRMADDPLAVLTDARSRGCDAPALLEAAYGLVERPDGFVTAQLGRLAQAQLPFVTIDRLVYLLLLPGEHRLHPDILTAALALYRNEARAQELRQEDTGALDRFHATCLQALQLPGFIRSPLDRSACGDKMEELLALRRTVQRLASQVGTEEAADAVQTLVDEQTLEMLKALQDKLIDIYESFHRALHRGSDALAWSELEDWRTACDPATAPRRDRKHQDHGMPSTR